MVDKRGVAGDPAARLAELAQEGGVSFAALSRMIGRNPSYLQQFVKRGSPRRLEETDRRRLAEFLGVAESELGGPPPGAQPRRRPSFAQGGEGGDWRSIPRLSLDASAGPGALGEGEEAFDAFRFSRRWLQEMGLEGADLSAIRVEGDSMEPLLRSGDEIFVDRNKRAGEGVFVVRIGDALHVKRVIASAPGRVVLRSENPAYAPIDLDRDAVEVIGRVVWKGGRV